MREIKFRAWDGRNKQMYNEASSTHQYLMRTDKQGICGVTVVKDTGHEQFLNIDDYDLEIMQYTGLKDKNGKEIYEGDILKIGEGKTRATMVVVWNEEEAKFGMKYADMVNNKLAVPMLKDGSKYYEIFSNIYEDPELVK